MRQWAISIGINQYQFFQPLSYAQRDAQAIQQFLANDAGVPLDQCVLLTETSPNQWDRSTYPDRENIQNWLDFITQRCVQPGDVLWFFFSGYGICQQGQDYLVPIAGTPADVQATAIPLEMIFRTLRRVSTANVLVLLDINRNESSFSYETVGTHTEHLANITGIPTILSCQPGQFSRETSALGHGFFTATLLDCLRSHQCTTVAALNQALSAHLPELSEHYWRPIQQPVTICPADKQQQLILPATAFPAAQPLKERTVTAETAIANGAAFLAMQTTGGIERLNLANGYTNGHSSQQVGTTATVPLSSNARFQTNGNGGMTTASGSISNPQAVSSHGGANATQVVNGSTQPPTALNGTGLSTSVDMPPQNYENKATHSDRVATVTQPHSDSPEDVNDLSDTLFWRSVLRWGGLAVVGLILGVLLRNHDSFTPKHPTAQHPAISSTGQTGSGQTGSGQAATGQQSLSTKPGTKSEIPGNSSVSPAVMPSLQPIASTQLGVSGTNQLHGSTGKSATAQPASVKGAASVAKMTASSPSSHLAKAKALIALNSDQASPYSDAIREAKQVQPGQPDYAQAKQDIALWSRQILSIARQRGRQGRFDAAIVAARLIPPEQPIHADAKGAIDRWCPALKKQRTANPVQREQAKGICQKGIG
ncbi:MAG: caspase family protein [Leptolyngbya sp. BL-A-14]